MLSGHDWRRGSRLAPVRAASRRPRLKLYSSRSWLPPGHEGAHVTALCPFWGRNQNVGAAGWPDYADKLIEVGPSFLELTDLPDADLAVFPARSRPLVREPAGLEYAQAFVDLARTAGKPAVFFYDSADTGFSRFPIDDVIVMRGSLLRSRQTEREFALPGFHDDLLAYAGGELPLRRKRGKPVVSFCGAVIREHPPKNLLWKTRRVAGSVRRYKWRMQGRHEEDLFVRAKAVDALLEQDDVETSIVLRESGGGGAWSGFDAERFRSIRREYVQNMIESDYVLCTRGDGNWSHPVLRGALPRTDPDLRRHGLRPSLRLPLAVARVLRVDRSLAGEGHRRRGCGVPRWSERSRFRRPSARVPPRLGRVRLAARLLRELPPAFRAVSVEREPRCRERCVREVGDSFIPIRSPYQRVGRGWRLGPLGLPDPQRPARVGWRSRMLVGERRNTDPDVRLLKRNAGWRAADRACSAVTDRLDLQYVLYPSSFGVALDPWFREADVVQLYNTHGSYFSHSALPLLTRRKPLVWRLSDMWAFTGHTAYSYECERWKTGCGSCPHLDVYPRLRRDRHGAPVALEADGLLAVADRRRRAVPLAARPRAGEPAARPLPDASDPERRRARRLRAAAARRGAPGARARPGSPDRALRDAGPRRSAQGRRAAAADPRRRGGATSSSSPPAAARRPTGARSLGRLDDERLALAYAAADVFVLPTLAENLPNTALESIACGTPVAAFAVGGVVRRGARRRDRAARAARRRRGARRRRLGLLDADLRDSCRAVAEREFGAEREARAFAALYEELVAAR